MAEQRLIDANALLKTLDSVWDCNDMVFEPNDHICNGPNDCKGCKWRETLDFAKRQVKASKTVDAVPVVRCKDCNFFHKRKWCSLNDTSMCDEDFCSYGERKDGENESSNVLTE